MKLRIVLGLLNLWISLSVSAHLVTITVVDDSREPIAGASTTIGFAMVLNGNDVEYAGLTGNDGVFSASGLGNHSVYVYAEKAGHYDARLRSLPNDTDLDLVVVLPRIRNPVPLCVRRVNVAVPVAEVWVGFDFEVGEWVMPYGRGRTADITMRFRNKFIGYPDEVGNLEEAREFSKRSYVARKEEWSEEKFKRDVGKWDAEMDVGFPTNGAGVIEQTGILLYSDLRMSHSAPLDGYVSDWKYHTNNYSPRTTREDVGFFLRTRVERDASGGIVSANYGKVVGDIRVAVSGALIFTYYFNPTPNDRNLEWNTKHNFVEGLSRVETPRLP